MFSAFSRPSLWHILIIFLFVISLVSVFRSEGLAANKTRQGADPHVGHQFFVQSLLQEPPADLMQGALKTQSITSSLKLESDKVWSVLRLSPT